MYIYIILERISLCGPRQLVVLKLLYFSSVGGGREHRLVVSYMYFTFFSVRGEAGRTGYVTKGKENHYKL